MIQKDCKTERTIITATEDPLRYYTIDSATSSSSHEVLIYILDTSRCRENIIIVQKWSNMPPFAENLTTIKL